MATTRSFNAMLNEYLCYDLLFDELAKRSYFIDKVEKDDKWKGGNMVVPFKGARASSFRMGGLVAESDISENEYVRGNVANYKEIWGAMKWNGRDLAEHDGGGDGVSEASFLSNLPGQIEDFLDDAKEVVSVAMMTGAHYVKRATPIAAATDDEANGLISIDRIERLTLGQKFVVDDDNSAAGAACYVRAININLRQATFYDARTGGALYDFTNYTVAQNAKFYVEGGETAANNFTSLRAQLLSAANGGDANLFGVSKLAYPYLQCLNLTGAAITASNILDQLFDKWTDAKVLGKVTATEFVMSYKHLGSIMKLLELMSGQYKNVDTKVSAYGWTEITIVGVKGSLKIVGVHEMDDDVIFLMDWKCLKLHSNKFWRKQQSPEGLQYYTVRATTGYTYIVDIVFYGELVVSKPTGCAVIFGISY